MPIVHFTPISVEAINYNVTTDLDMHDYRIKNVAEATTTKDALRLNQWTAWTPTLTWASATPANIVKTARYVRIGKTVYWTLKITATDGNDTTGLTISLPVVQADNTKEFYNASMEKYSAIVWIDPWCFTYNDLINFDNFHVCASGNALIVRASGFYEV